MKRAALFSNPLVQPVIKIIKGTGFSIVAILLLLTLWAGWKRFSIQQEEVEFKSGALTMRGTLLTPRFIKKTPGVVLVHGSGQTSRKSTILYAWIFASQGYAALAYDKRGVGQSEGGSNDWNEFNFDDLANDAAAGYRFLQSNLHINRERVGFFGASQGGWVVSLAANRVENPAFLIMASASVSTVAEDRIYGREAQVRHAGFGEEAVNQARDLITLDHQVTRSGEGYEKFLAAWERYRKTDWFTYIYRNSAPLTVNDPHRLWERKILDFDPQPFLKTIKAPVLWVFGDPNLDRFSPVRLSISRVKQSQGAGKPYQILQINNAGHTLEYEGGNRIQTLLQIRLPLLWKTFQWLEIQTTRNN